MSDEAQSEESRNTSQLNEQGSADLPPLVSLRSLTKQFVSPQGTIRVLDEVDLTIPSGQFVALLGPSGCGKSTILNMVAGLIPTTSGNIRFRDSFVSGVNTAVGYMTQQDSLFPWRTVRKNVELPLEIRGLSPSERSARASTYLELVQLEDFQESFPSQLSGGMRKRVGLAQTLASEPELLLLDEPFGALDAMLRTMLQQELLRLGDETGVEMLLVTHDIAEAVALTDRIIVLSARPGRILADVPIDFSRPRQVNELRASTRFHELQSDIWQILQDQVEVE